MAFQLTNHLWKEGYVEDSIKLHYLMILMIAAPMPVSVRLGEDDEEGRRRSSRAQSQGWYNPGSEGSLQAIGGVCGKMPRRTEIGSSG